MLVVISNKKSIQIKPKSIYIQDVDASNIAERVMAIYEYLQINTPRIIPKTDVGQFFIPNELG